MDELDQPRPSRLSYLARRLWKPLLAYALYSALVTWLEYTYLADDVTISADIQAVASFFLGALMALRINTSYNKWWEARTLWGRLVNEERNMAAYVAALGSLSQPAREQMRAHLTEFPIVLMRHLRGPGPVHEPARVSAAVFAELQQWKAKAWIDGWEWSRLSLVAESLLAVCGGCERIRNSPLTLSYQRTVRACAWIYLACAPLVLHCRAWTIPLVVTMAFFFFVLELVAADIDEPFGRAPEDLPLETLCQTIRASVSQILTNPAPVSP